MVRKSLVGVLSTVLATGAMTAAVFACNSLVGVEEVTKKKGRDSGAPINGEDVVDSPPSDSGRNRPNVFQTALGEAHSCARKPDGTVKCWGTDDLGQTGSNGDSINGIADTPRIVKDVTDAVDIAAGRNHTCIARQTGTVSCWGYNVAGQLGNGESNNVKTTPVDVVSLKGVAVAAGGDFSCAIRTQGTVACWGGNDSGQLGRGNAIGSITPVAVTDLTDVVAISAGQAHVCAVKSDGGVLCWGEGMNGQLGYGAVGNKPKPVLVESLPPAQNVATGQRSTCALTRENTVYCWGANEVGQLGTGAPNTTANPSPIIVTNLNDAIAIRTGRNHTCATRKTGAVVCWGAGDRGQLGDGADGGARASAGPVSDIRTAIGIGAGGDHACAPTSDDTVLCWGANDRGQLGNASTNAALLPVKVAGYP
jgi:alpha-tubulin suppressor-like RCC1 family protein